ncbi:MAG: hypothetical protein JSR58_03505 [Verrucomicrobia bacterium]|nr:hypothetical protein [Verrucomicrobiota bacterium]
MIVVLTFTAIVALSFVIWMKFFSQPKLINVVYQLTSTNPLAGREIYWITFTTGHNQLPLDGFIMDIDSLGKEHKMITLQTSHNVARIKFQQWAQKYIQNNYPGGNIQLINHTEDYLNYLGYQKTVTQSVDYNAEVL